MKAWWGLGLAVCALLAAPASSVAADAAAGCRLAQIAELPVRFKANQPFVKAQINGQDTWLLFDTGAWTTTLFSPAAARLKLSLSRMRELTVGGTGGKAAAISATLSSVKLGGYDVRNLTVIVLDDVVLRSDASNGLVGRDLFAEVDIELDLKNSMIRFLDTKSCRTDLAYWAKEYSVEALQRSSVDGFFINVVLNGKRMLALIDSGASISYITTPAAARVGVTPRLTDATEGVGGIGRRTVPVKVSTFRSLELGGEVVSNVSLRVGNLFAGTETVPTGTRLARRSDNEPEVILGADFLRSHRVLLSNAQRRVFFSHNGGPIFQVVDSDPDGVRPRP